MPVLCVILAGGLGTRISEETQEKPKPLVTIGGKPIIWHIMMIYASQGFNDFLIAGGYKNEMLAPEIKKHLRHNSKINFEVLDTGLKTSTGGRIKKCMEHAGLPRILATYGDGLGNIKLKNLIELHEQNESIATLTAVRPPARFGRVVIQDNLVTHFGEKIQSDEGWINGGFFVLEKDLSSFISSDEMPLEQYPFSHLSSIGKLGAYKHEDFWQPMDTLREKQELEKLWQSNLAPWKIW